jgi:hypothetical protein
MRATAFVVVLPLVFLLFTPATAWWSSDPDSNLPICTAAYTQQGPQLVGDGSGGAIITWRDSRSGSFSDIYAQRVDANGDTLWPADGLAISTAAYNQEAPQLVGDGSGGAIIAWHDYRSGSSYDIYAQRVDANGDTLWPADGLAISTAASDQYSPQLVGDGSGGAIIAWHDYRSGNWDIYAQRVDANGDTLWPADGLAISTAANNQYFRQLVGDGSGGAIITWWDSRSGSYSDIYAQRVDANGDTLWPADGVAICTAAYSQQDPQLVGDGSGGAIITWEDYRSGNWDIYAQRVDANGDTLWPAAGVAICTVAYSQQDPQLVGDGSGGAIITWEHYRSGSSYDIYAQRVDANGDTLWPADGVAISTAAYTQEAPQLVGDGSGGAIITWHDYRSGSSYDIYAQRVDANGDALWPADGVAISTAAYTQEAPQLVGDGSGGAIITWEDYQSGSSNDIYAQRVNFNGVLGPVPHIISINDVPDDQGGQVAIFWDRSYLDAPEYQMITHYSIWRRYPWGPKIESMGEEWDGSFPKGFAPVVYRRIDREDGSGENKKEYWEYMGSVEAHLFEVYVSVQPTFNDSSASGVPYCSFFVSAHAGEPFPYWDSAPDSGYSVDNISPAKTQMSILAAGGSTGPVSTIWLSWDKVSTGEDGSPEKGAIRYRVYCDTHPSFTPGAGNMLAETASLSYLHTDARIGDPAANLFYLVTVTDGSDNESAVSNRVGEFDKSLSAAK